MPPLERLRRERDNLRARLGEPPDNPSDTYAWIQDQIVRERQYAADAEARRGRDRRQLDALGPIGRRTHRTERRDLETRVAGFDNQIDRHSRNIEALNEQLAQLEPDMSTWRHWNDQHRAELDRLRDVTRSIITVESVQRQQLTIARNREHSHNLDVGRGR